MIDEHTRVSLLHVVERSITAERLVAELEDAFATAGGPPKVLRMDNGPEYNGSASDTVDAVRPTGHRNSQIGEYRARRIRPRPPVGVRQRSGHLC